MMPACLRPEILPFASVEIVPAPTSPEPTVLVCAYCPGFDPTASARGVSHGICATCVARVFAALLVADGGAA